MYSLNNPGTDCLCPAVYEPWIIIDHGFYACCQHLFEIHANRLKFFLKFNDITIHVNIFLDFKRSITCFISTFCRTQFLPVMGVMI